MKVVMDARTVAIVKDLTIEQRSGINGSFESKEVLFRIAVDRDYKVTKYENGQPVQSNPTDFFLAKATGNIAQAFADHCTAKKENGKLASRHLLLTGAFETYQKDRIVTQTVPVNFSGQTYNIDVSLSVPDTNYIFVVESMKFLDRPQNAQGNGNTQTLSVGTPVLAGTAPQGAPVAVPVGQVPVAPVAQAPQAPIASQVPVAPVAPQAPVASAPQAPMAPQAPVAPANAVQNAVNQVVNDMNNAMNPPTVDSNFVPATSNSAPF